MTSTLFVPLISDWVVKDEQGDVVTHVRFDSIEAQQPLEFKHDIAHLSVEPLTGSATIEITIDVWRELVEAAESFVERAYGVVKARWPRTIDSDMEVKFDEDETLVTVEVGDVLVERFERTTVFFKDPQTGVNMLRLEAWDPSFPMRLQSWVIYHSAVDSLIEINNGGNIDRGL